MVFLFPGVLFRRFYFSGSASKQFNQGNLLERFLWTLLTSVICLTICGIVFYIIDGWLNTSLLHNITYDKILNVFECLSQNEFPDTFRYKDDVRNLGIVLLFIYAISGIMGLFIVKVVRLFSLDSFIEILRFSDDWQYLSKPYRKHGLKKSFGDIHIPYVDILTSHKDKEELYKGILKDFITDKDNKLEHIIISNADKFIQLSKTTENQDKITALRKLIKSKKSGYRKHAEYDDKVIFVKSISGDLFVLPNQNILNINFTYAKARNVLERWDKYIIQALLFSFYVLVVVLVVFPFLHINSPYFNTLSRKIIFSIFTAIMYICLIASIQGILIKVGSEKIGITLLLTVSFATPYLWVFNVLSFWSSFFVFLILFSISFTMLARSSTNDS